MASEMSALEGPKHPVNEAAAAKTAISNPGVLSCMRSVPSFGWGGIERFGGEEK